MSSRPARREVKACGVVYVRLVNLPAHQMAARLEGGCSIFRFPSMQQPPPLPPSPSSPESSPRISKDAFSIFVEGFKGLPGRILNSPKPQPLKWNDRFPIIFAALFFCWPIGILFVWLTKRFEKADKKRLTAVAVLWGLMLPVIFDSKSGSTRGDSWRSSQASEAKGNQREQVPTKAPNFSRQFAALESLARDTFGTERFRSIENKGDVQEAVEFLQIHVQPPDLDAKSICMDILEFFVEAQEAGLLKGVEFVNFHFHADIIRQNGREENMEVLRLALGRRMIESTEWSGYDKYLHIDLVKRQLLSQADDSFFYSALDWKEHGWKE